MSYRFYRDDHGDLRAETGRGLRLLGRFLEADIQGSRGVCDEVLAAFADIAAGRRKRWQMTGNAHTLTLSKRRARIHAESGRNTDLVLSPAVLRQALLEWQALLENASRRRPR
jgi:uncharacterized protein YacL (UPF0231 family)